MWIVNQQGEGQDVFALPVYAVCRPSLLENNKTYQNAPRNAKVANEIYKIPR
jgi:hypothetical protein